MDLTYFIEYYIDLLARALVDKKEREKRRSDDQNKEALERERQMAHQPLGVTTSAPQSHAIAPEGQYEPQAKEEAQHETETTESPPSAERQASIQTALQELMISFSTKTTERKERIVKTLTAFLMQGIRSFTREQWQIASSIAQGTASDDCCYMLKNGIAAARRDGLYATYTLTDKVSVNPDTLDAADDYTPMRHAHNFKEGTHHSEDGEGTTTTIKGGQQTSKNRSIKYVCSHCGVIIRVTREVNVVCGDCNVAFERV